MTRTFKRSSEMMAKRRARALYRVSAADDYVRPAVPQIDIAEFLLTNYASGTLLISWRRKKNAENPLSSFKTNEIFVGNPNFFFYIRFYIKYNSAISKNSTYIFSLKFAQVNLHNYSYLTYLYSLLITQYLRRYI